MKKVVLYVDVLSIVLTFFLRKQKLADEDLTPCELTIDESQAYTVEESLSDEEKAIIRERKEAERQFNSGEKIICTICRKVFKTNFELQRHFRSHGLAFLKTSNNAIS